MTGKRKANGRIAPEQALEISVRVQECAWIAILLAQENDIRLDTALARGPEAAEAEWEARRRRTVFAHYFATMGLLHLGCPMNPCKRARRCAHAGLFCMRGKSLAPDEEAHARARFQAFIRIVSVPESESERAVAGRRESSGGA